MDKTFDEMFNEFFSNRDEFFKNNNIDKRLRQEAINMIEMLKHFGITDESLQKELDTNLGTPDKVENYVENGLSFERSVWYTDNGEIVRIITTEAPFTTKETEKSLEMQLKDAIDNEDYLKAAKLRDLINPPKKRGRRKKE